MNTIGLILEEGMSLSKTIDQILKDFHNDISSVKNSKDLEQIKINYLGKKGKVASLMPFLKSCSEEERPLFGKHLNELKQSITEKCDLFEKELSSKELNQKFEKEWVDITLPGKKPPLGVKHPVTQMLERILETLNTMGFTVQYGPDIETDYYNFDSLNFEKDHPAKDMQDTFYISTDHLLRTHTSNVQVHAMENNKPPIRIVAPGKCFRNETISARSHVFFHQVEGLYIDKDVSFSDLLQTMSLFWKKLLGRDIKTRFRPSYFPFVEPGVEVDVHCSACNGSGCRICKHSGWLEVAGAGMVHPNVLKSGGIDPEEYSGYAWGLGVERLALLEYGIPDIRYFTENDLRFLHQFY